MPMETNLIIEEGHNFDLEEIISLVTWTVPELIKQEWKNKDIINFRDNSDWKKQARIFLARIKNNEK